jgi:hypothetical protein
MRVPFNADGITEFPSSLPVQVRFETQAGFSAVVGMAGDLTILFFHVPFF